MVLKKAKAQAPARLWKTGSSTKVFTERAKKWVKGLARLAAFLKEVERKRVCRDVVGCKAFLWERPAIQALH